MYPKVDLHIHYLPYLLGVVAEQHIYDERSDIERSEIPSGVVSQKSINVGNATEPSMTKWVPKVVQATPISIVLYKDFGEDSYCRT